MTKAAKATAKVRTSRQVLRLKHTTLGLQGELDRDALTELGDRLHRLLDRGCHWVVLDFSEVAHVDYRGVPALAARAEAFRRVGGDLKISGLSRYLQAVFRASGALDAFEVFRDAADARSALRGPFDATH